MFEYYQPYHFFPTPYRVNPSYYSQPITLPNYYHSFNYVPMPLQFFSFNQQPSGFLQAFYNENGTFDFIKAAKTVDQMIKTVNQVTPLIKQFSLLLNRL